MQKFWAWVVGGLLGSSLAILLNTLLLWLGVETPGALHESEIRRQQEMARPMPPHPPLPQEKTPSPAPVPDRNEIRLPLPPDKLENGPLQVAEPPPPFDPNAGDENGVTPLMRAAACGDVEAMEALVAQGADVNATDPMAHGALYYAVTSKSGTAVEWLIAHGAAVDANCCDGAHSPLLHALATGELGVIEPILRIERPALWCRPAREALDAALRTQDKPMIRALLAYHRSAPTADDSRQPLLGYAVARGDLALLHLLLECGANPNTPLESPVDKAFSRLIASAPVREYLETEAGMTPLMLAAATGQLQAVQSLLEYGAKRGTSTKRHHMTAIDFAARHNVGPEMLQVLLGKSPRPEDQRMWINVSIGSQRAVLYKDGRVALVMPVSTGMPGFPTPTGRFVVTDKDRMHRSTLYPAYMPYFLRMSCRDFGLHAGELPGYPASHGCIRLPWDSAQRLFREVDIGTLVTISR